jgi:hypothetical protein
MNRERRSRMATGSRYRHALVGLVALLVCVAGVATARAENYLQLKGGWLTNGVEYEHVAGNGVGISVTGSYSSYSGVTYRVVGAGLKKYLGDRRAFYVAVYPQLSYTTVKASSHESRSEIFPPSGWSDYFDGTADARLFMLHGGLGWRGARGRFGYGGELGMGTAFPAKLDIKGVRTYREWGWNWSTEETGPYTWEDWEIFRSSGGTTVTPMLHLFVGVRL